MLCKLGRPWQGWGAWGGLGVSYLNVLLEIILGLEQGLAVVLALVCGDAWGQGMGTGWGQEQGGFGVQPSLTVDASPAGAGEAVGPLERGAVIFAPGWTDRPLCPAAWCPLPSQPLGSPRWGHPTRLGTHRDGGLLQWPKGSPILLGAARAARSCYGVHGLGMVPTSPPACPQPPPCHPPPQDGGIALVSNRTPLPTPPQPSCPIPALGGLTQHPNPNPLMSLDGVPVPGDTRGAPAHPNPGAAGSAARA